MSISRLRQGFFSIVLVLAVITSTNGCGMKGSSMDDAGMSLAEVENLSLEQQYHLMRERYEVMQSQFAQAQLQVSDDAWTWITYGIGPDPGTTAPHTLAGANGENSYFLQMSASIQLPGATGEQSDLQPMIEYFESQSWEYEILERGVEEFWWVVSAETDEGTILEYRVQANGYYNLSLYSGTFWGETSALDRAVSSRLPEDWVGAEKSLPGESTQMPDWTDAVVDTSNSIPTMGQILAGGTP